MIGIGNGGFYRWETRKNVPFREIESPHPYLPHENRTWQIEEPNAEGYALIFAPETRTEQTHDPVVIQSWEGDRNLETYSGGRGGSSSNFPGINGRPPYILNMPRFRVRFTSDQSQEGESNRRGTT
jgi:hypothetical protein